ncbi:MAG: hypothetical protein ACFBSF_13225 [Leptolyngbyaceae cyanobacterium]
MVTGIFVSLQKIFRQLTLTLLSVILCLGLLPTTAQSMPLAETGYMDTISPERLSQMKAQRRKTQSEASQAAKTKAESSLLDEDNASLGEMLIEKLNLDEITEENVLVEGTSDNSESSPSSVNPR